MDTEQSMKQNLEFSRELCCREAENIIFCKILLIFSYSAQFADFCDRRILVGLKTNYILLIGDKCIDFIILVQYSVYKIIISNHLRLRASSVFHFIVVFTPHVLCFFGLAGVTFAFISNFHLPNESPNFNTVVKNFSV